ncbi:MAG TPA: hypothetical protein VMH89_10720 [Candidatus Acidoferrum sp.]|nr:hypothetical protein [Candidatus Acidoferrum sp.]
MAGMIIFCVGALLEALVLLRGYQQKLLREFPCFYAYLLFVALDDLARLSVYRWVPDQYVAFYWITQYVALALGAGVVIEVYRVALRPFPGVARLARTVLLIVFFGVFSQTIVMSSGDVWTRMATSALAVERNLRIAQVAAILSLVSLFRWYAVPFGRNLKGILLGYGTFVGLSSLQFILWYFRWEPVTRYWQTTEPFVYLLVLLLWAAALWSYQPAPQLSPENRFAQDYQLVVASTRAQFRRTLARLGWAVRA